MKLLFVLVQLGAAVYLNNHEAKCTLRTARHFAAVLLTTLINKFRLCSSAEAGIVHNLFLNFEQK